MQTITRTCVVTLLAAVTLCAQQSRQNSKSPAVGPQAPKQRPVTILKEPTVLGSGETWAVIYWTSNEGGKGRSAIFAGTRQTNLKPLDQTIADADVTIPVDSYQEQEYTHLVRLNSLKPGTTYYFRADSSSEGDHGGKSRSGIWTFTTGTPEPLSPAKTAGMKAQPASAIASTRPLSKNGASTQAGRSTPPNPLPGPAANNLESARLLRPSPSETPSSLPQRPQLR